MLQPPHHVGEIRFAGPKDQHTSVEVEANIIRICKQAGNTSLHHCITINRHAWSCVVARFTSPTFASWDSSKPQLLLSSSNGALSRDPQSTDPVQTSSAGHGFLYCHPSILEIDINLPTGPSRSHPSWRSLFQDGQDVSQDQDVSIHVDDHIVLLRSSAFRVICCYENFASLCHGQATRD